MEFQWTIAHLIFRSLEEDAKCNLFVWSIESDHRIKSYIKHTIHASLNNIWCSFLYMCKVYVSRQLMADIIFCINQLMFSFVCQRIAERNHMTQSTDSFSLIVFVFVFYLIWCAFIPSILFSSVCLESVGSIARTHMIFAFDFGVHILSRPKWLTLYASWYDDCAFMLKCCRVAFRWWYSRFVFNNYSKISIMSLPFLHW